jgi:hypothetical protein
MEKAGLKKIFDERELEVGWLSLVTVLGVIGHYHQYYYYYSE